jgi:hypothetical protein
MVVAGRGEGSTYMGYLGLIDPLLLHVGPPHT